MRPPKLDWDDAFAGSYMIQSAIVRGEPRVYYAILRGGTGRHPERWSGPSRRTQNAAKIDAEYHAAGRLEDRPPCFAYRL